MIALAQLLAAGCASGGSDVVDAAHERPPRPDAAPGSDAAVGDDGGSGARPDAASALDAGSSGSVADAAAGADAGPRGDAGRGCCSSSADCGALEVCVVAEPGSTGVCERAPAGRECWTDADCESGETCGGVRVSRCGDPRVLFDTPGRCR